MNRSSYTIYKSPEINKRRLPCKADIALGKMHKNTAETSLLFFSEMQKSGKMVFKNSHRFL